VLITKLTALSPKNFLISTFFFSHVELHVCLSTLNYSSVFCLTLLPESVIVKALPYMLRALYNGDVAVFTLLDLSAAFDTVSYDDWKYHMASVAVH